MTTFGDRLRSAREKRGLSQTELGGERYTASYVSHLERNKRRPTPEVLEYFARRLDVSPAELATPGQQSVSNEQIAAAVGQLTLQDALLRHENDAVLLNTNHASVSAAQIDASTWWTTLRLRGEALLIAGRYDACAELANQLMDNELAIASAELRASALALKARALRARGSLLDSRSAADAAVEAASESQHSEIYVSALLAAISARAELGQIDDLAERVNELGRVRDGLASTQLRGLVAWAIGNVHFLLGNVEAGATEHDYAARELRPDADLRAWARFHKASAAMRISGGLLEGVDDMLTKASQGLSLVGNEEDQAELELVLAERSLTRDPTRAIRIIDATLGKVDLPPHTRADAQTIQARAFEALGRAAEARAAWMAAAELFSESGAADKAISAWRQFAATGTA